LTIPNGILLYGPPGCGKTYIARQLAIELGYKFFEISPSDLGSSFLHGTAQNIRELFDDAAKNAPSVVFIDEFDALVPSRTDMGGNHPHRAEEVNEFLARMAECSKQGILLIAATNHPWNIDPAIQRTGRLDKKIYVGPPDLIARSEMLAHHLVDKPTSSTVNTGAAASQLAGYSSSDLKAIVEEAARLAFKSNKPIGQEHLEAAKEIVSASISPDEESRHREWGTRTVQDTKKNTPQKVGFID
jgi:transitional endoplasmic reticulum ATPase